ncbi:phosphotransferase [Citricoccus sp. K5]|uniref:phosphotransferase n=1 Tax=Citricoccus sp. K5 TaxID=2653135 RepID=UPI001F2D8199|nr:phosphotransferase [Citricoccus sp. K5]
MELAALASAAIPDLSPTGVVGSPDDPRDFSAAVVFDRQGSRWRVRSPLHEEAAMRLETELQVLSGFTPGIRAGLPFRVPSVAGAVRLDGMRTFVYHDMPGEEMELEDLTELGGKTPDDIGRVIAAVHALPAAVVENADLPVYTADQFRQRRLNELDQAATTGRIPAILLRRWENALEEMELWEFSPVVAHGDLHEDNLLVDQGRLVSVTGWTDLHIGDPAEDFAWLASSGNQEFTDQVVKAYWQHRSGGTVQDGHLLRRAVLAAEFALAQWLVRGIAADDEEMAAEAEAMLQELEADVEEHGGQAISAAPAVAPAAHPQGLAPASTDDPADDDDTGEGTDDDDAVIMDRARAPEQEGTDEAPGADQPVTHDAASEGSEDELVPDELAADEAESGHPSEAVGPDDAEAPDDGDDPEDAEEVSSTQDVSSTEVQEHAEEHGDSENDDAEHGPSGSHAAAPHQEGPPTTALDLDEVRQLDIRRTTNPS